MADIEAIRNTDSGEDLPPGLIAPITGLTYRNGLLYVAHRTRVSTLDPQTGEFKTIIDDLPAWGEFQNNKVIFGPDDKMYFFVSTQGNSGVVDGHFLKVLQSYNKPNKSEVPCEDVTLADTNFTFRNPFTPDTEDEVTYDAYVPFGENVPAGTTIEGDTKCNGAFLRSNPDGSDLEVFAWGLRSDFGYRFNAAGELISSQNSGNPLPPREVYDDWEIIWKVEQGKWYGWPDYFSGLPITNERFRSPNEPNVTDPQPHDFVLTEETRQRLLQNEPLPPQPLVRLDPHVSAQGFVFGDSFGYGENDILLAEFGTVIPYLRQELPGFRVESVDITTGQTSGFLVNKSRMPASATGDGGLERPLQLEYAPDGSLYVVDFGVINVTEDGLNATPNTGVIWRVTRTSEGIPETGGIEPGPAILGVSAALMAGIGLVSLLALTRRRTS